MATVFVIRNSDGDTTVKQMTEEEFLRQYNEKGSGLQRDCLNQTDLHRHSDTNTWGDDILVIRGEIVQPKPKTTVTEFIL